MESLFTINNMYYNVERNNRHRPDSQYWSALITEKISAKIMSLEPYASPRSPARQMPRTLFFHSIQLMALTLLSMLFPLITAI